MYEFQYVYVLGNIFANILSGNGSIEDGLYLK